VLITQKSIEKLKPGKDRLQFVDDEITGLGVRIQPDGEKSFFWSARIQGTLRFRKLGTFPAVSVEQARLDARKLIGIASAWKRDGYPDPDPFETKPKTKPAGVPTFKDLTEAYIEEQVRGQAAKPDKAEADLRCRLKTHFSKWMDRKIDTLTIQDMLAVRNACGRHHIAANRCVELIRRIFNWCAASKDGEVNYWPVENPAKSVVLFEEKSRDVFLQPEQLVKFHECLANEPHVDLKDFLILAMASGARKGDIFSMRWQDWHRERHVWTVPFPKNEESYDINLMPSATAVLERRRAQAEDSAIYVFPGVGEEKHLMELRKPWDAFRKRAGIPDIHVHDLRRTVGSYLAINGTPLQQIAAALGHRSMQSTLVYARLQNQAIMEARQGGESKMQELMKSAKKRMKLAGRRPKLLKAVLA
jgi:integrase